VKQTGQVQICVKNIVGGIKVESRDSVDGIVTRLKAGRPSSRGSVPGKEKCVVVFTNLLYRPLDLSIFYTDPWTSPSSIQTLGPLHLPIIEDLEFFSGVKAAGT